MELTVAEIARRLSAVLEGEGSGRITGVAGLREARPGDIAFFANPRYAPYLKTTEATAVVAGRDVAAPPQTALLRVDDPVAAFAAVAGWFAPPPVPREPGVHPSAIVAPDARIGHAASIGPWVVIEPGATLGDRCRIGAGCYVGHGAVLGDEALLHPYVTIHDHCRLGDRVIVHSGAVIGCDGFGYDVDEQGIRTKQPQIGIVEIGNDVEIGANTTIDRARFGRTRIGNGVKIDNLVQIAHNVVVEDHAVLVAQVGIAGSTRVGTHVIFAGQSGAAGHLVIGAHSVVGARGGVTKDVPPKAYVTGYPAAPHKEAARTQAHINRLPQLKQRVAELEARLRELEGR